MCLNNHDALYEHRPTIACKW